MSENAKRIWIHYYTWRKVEINKLDTTKLNVEGYTYGEVYRIKSIQIYIEEYIYQKKIQIWKWLPIWERNRN